MARRKTTNNTVPTKQRNGSNSFPLWVLGGLGVIVLVAIMLFSRNDDKERSKAQTPTTNTRSAVGTRVVKMRSENGVYYIPARINGQELEFIFDTGASSVLISQLEVTLLYKQGKLTDEDVLGEVQSQIADGSVVNNTAIILRSVEVAGVELKDVQALVSDNVQAPLLLGQSVMSQFGSFTMDYQNNTVTFR